MNKKDSGAHWRVCTGNKSFACDATCAWFYGKCSQCGKKQGETLERYSALPVAKRFFPEARAELHMMDTHDAEMKGGRTVIIKALTKKLEDRKGKPLGTAYDKDIHDVIRDESGVISSTFSIERKATFTDGRQTRTAFATVLFIIPDLVKAAVANLRNVKIGGNQSMASIWSALP